VFPVSISLSPSLLKDPAPLREAKAMANTFALTNLLEEIVASKPAFELSADLEVLFFSSFTLDSLLIHDYRPTFQNTPPRFSYPKSSTPTRAKVPRRCFSYVSFSFTRPFIYLSAPHRPVRKSSNGSGLASPTGWSRSLRIGLRSFRTASTR
jgi:hypothetical protein